MIIQYFSIHKLIFMYAHIYLTLRHNNVIFLSYQKQPEVLFCRYVMAILTAYDNYILTAEYVFPRRDLYFFLSSCFTIYLQQENIKLLLPEKRKTVALFDILSHKNVMFISIHTYFVTIYMVFQDSNEENCQTDDTRIFD